MASCSLVLPVYMLTIVISNIFGAGGGTLIARLIGKGEDDEASRVSAACIWMALGLGLAFSLMCFFVMTPLLIFLGASDNVLEYSRQYMFFVVVLGGIPAAVGVILFDLCNIVINRLSASYGDIELAAIGIVLKAERLPLNIGIGICLGMIPLLAYNYSSGNRKRMDEFFRFGRAVGLGIGITCVILYYVFAPVIMQAFIGDAETVRYGTMFLRARCFATPLMFLCFSMVHFTQAIGRGNASFWMAVIRQIVFNIQILFLFNRLFGVMGIVWTQIVADIFTVIVSYIIYAGIRKSEGWPAGL